MDAETRIERDDRGGAGEVPRGRERVRAGWGARLRWAVGATLALGLIVGGGAAAVMGVYARASAEDPRAPTPPLPVRAADVVVSPFYEVTSRHAGRIEPARETRLAFERGGLLTSIAVEEGARVSAGVVVAALDTELLDAALDRQRAELRRLEARLDLAERTSARQGALADRGFSSNQRFDEARFEAQALAAEIDAVNAQIRATEIDLKKSRLRAPFAGVVGARMVDEGAVVSAGQGVAMLQEIARPQARIGAPPDVAERLAAALAAPGGAARAYVIEAAGRRFRARLAAVRPDLDPSARTVTALFDLLADEDGRGETPAMGEVARLELKTRIDAPGAWIPLSALQEGVDGLWTVNTLRPALSEDGATAPGERIVGREAVEVVHVEGGRAFVRGSLRDGDTIIAAGVNRVAPGQRVSIAPATEPDAPIELSPIARPEDTPAAAR